MDQEQANIKIVCLELALKSIVIKPMISEENSEKLLLTFENKVQEIAEKYYNFIKK